MPTFATQPKIALSCLWSFQFYIFAAFTLEYTLCIQLDSKYQFDLIEELKIRNRTYVGTSIVEGFHRFSPAILLRGDTRHLQIPMETYVKLSELLAETNELTILATVKQEQKNTGTVVSFSEGNERFLELQSSGRKDEIRLHYTHKNNTYIETFPYHLADSSWHKIAVTVSGNTVFVYVDCVQIYKRIIYDIDQDFVSRNLSLWLGQRNPRHFMYKGCLQDVKIIAHPHGYILQCPQLETGCPTCGEFKQLEKSLLHLENQVKELTKRLAEAEQLIQELKECDCEKSCLANGSLHPDGSTWKSDCNLCTCIHGHINCRPVSCSPPLCKNPVNVPGECCPVCLKKCLLENIPYDHGERVSPVKCVTCECKNGSMHCRRIDPELSCPMLSCPEEEQFSVPGECCQFCPGVDYCSQGHDCHQNASCINLKTQYACQCTRGFTGDGKHCEDINECLSEGGYEGHHCRMYTTCVNLPGDYICECLPGFKRVDAYNCIDDALVAEYTEPSERSRGPPFPVRPSHRNTFPPTSTSQKHDECSTGEHSCHADAECVNTAGSYICRCLDGYTGDGFTCTPVCSLSCANGGECIAPNTCLCRHGYSGEICEIDVDECSLGLDMCHPSSECVNMPGWYYCKCRPGYETYPDDSYGTFCQDVDECISGSHTCHLSATCVNEDGSYRCECLDNLTCSSGCFYYGEEHWNGEIWSADLCTECRCADGVVTCQPTECDCSKTDVDTECCPHCDHSTVCEHQETKVAFHNGDQWIYQCQICECLHGEIDCWEMECPPLTCENPFRNPGDCCPRCENDPCSVVQNSNSSNPTGCAYSKHMYQTGERTHFVNGPCSSCHCQVSSCQHSVRNTGCSAHGMKTAVHLLRLVTTTALFSSDSPYKAISLVTIIQVSLKLQLLLANLWTILEDITPFNIWQGILRINLCRLSRT